MKKIILVISLLLLIALIATYIFLLPTKKIEIQDVKVSFNQNPLKVEITYPEIEGLDDFNQKSKAIVDKILEDFKTNSLANDNAVKETDPENYATYPREYDLLISYQNGQVDNDLVSVVLDVYSFEGGAHGAHYFISLNYSPKLKKEVNLADFFPTQPNYLSTISDFCIKDLTEQILQKVETTEGLWVQDGAGPKEENYSVFLANKDNIVFYFSPYQVAPWALGDFKVIMPR